ncbi:MAG: anaerobic ribonucleoside-triphosphate reductase activating protein [Planctomycetia bacterium]|nr:anaerobic ribonucleoside-triphosphate reductase activating protein [Planctomycetia bacterium]
MTLRIAGRIADSIVDGPGLRYALFLQGCPRACPGCHNPQTHDPLGGYEVSIEDVLKEIDSDPLLDGVTFSGGEPFMQAHELIPLADQILQRNLNLITYTGYLWEELIESDNPDWRSLLERMDVLVDGPFVQELRDWKLKFTGSSNQRIIAVKPSLQAKTPVVLTELTHMPSNAALLK